MKKFFLLTVAILPLLCGCGERMAQKRFFAFDTEIIIKLDAAHEQLADEVQTMCREMESLFSRTKEGSDIWRINRGERFSPSEQTLELIEKGLCFCRLSSGAFDITVEPLSSLWDFPNASAPPDAEAISNALKEVDYRRIDLEKLDFGGARLDMGAIAKGYAADEITRFFKQEGVTDAIISLGGNVCVTGREFRVGIVDPCDPNTIYAVITLQDKSAVTSGIYQRCFEYGGKLYHHILDTKTGYSVENSLASVTVISPSSTTADALSTICMAVGEERARAILHSVPDTDAMFIYRDGSFSVTDEFSEKYSMER
ncbi:MAG: FAD:protein FMN transferase [Clostridia bacterium]|nr:FAD:protein FMN transferase [Clostridia bacterium]